MQKWEYDLIKSPSLGEIVRRGENGWELCATDRDEYFYFKRPLEDHPEDSIMKE